MNLDLTEIEILRMERNQARRQALEAERRAFLAQLDAQAAAIEMDDAELEHALAKRFDLDVDELRKGYRFDPANRVLVPRQVAEPNPEPKPKTKTTRKPRRARKA